MFMFRTLLSRLFVGSAEERIVSDARGASIGLPLDRTFFASRPRVARMNQRRLSSGERLEGRSLMAADFDGDGFEDMAIGAPSAVDRGFANAGEVIVTYGAFGAAYTNVQRLSKSIVGLAPNADDFFGKALAAGDYNRDGFDDLAIGVPGDNSGAVDAGSVVVLYGSRRGLTPVATVFQQGVGGVPNVRAAGDYFGDSLTAGDVNADGYDDLAIGVPGENYLGRADSGLVHVLAGGGAGLLGGGWTFGQDTAGGLVEPNDQFGKVLAMGRFNGDARLDIVVGVPNEDGGAGAINVLYVTGGRPHQYFTQGMIGVSTAVANDQLGASLAVGDFDDDGFDDVALGAPGEDTGAIIDHGAVQVMYSNGVGLGTARALLVLQSAFPDLLETGDQFGFSVAAGDFDGDGVDDLAIGTPFEDVGAAIDGGAVDIIFGRAGGLNFGRTVHLTQSGGSETGDHYGAALGVLDFDGDGRDDLAIGVPDEDVLSSDEGAVELRRNNGAIALYLDEYILATGAGAGHKFGSSAPRM
jgi:hypothetical protein